MKATLQNSVVIGFCDVSAAGCRAVLGINKEVERFKLKTCEIDTGNLKSQIINDDEELPVFSKAECDNEKVTMISVSSQIDSGTASHFFNEILDHFQNSEAKEIVIIAAIPIKMNAVKETDVFQIAVNCNKVANIKCLPDEFLIKDSIINMAIQFVQVEKVPLRCFITQGYKIGSGRPNQKDGSLQSIANLQNVLNSLYGLNFDAEKTQSLVYKESMGDVQLQNIMFL